MSGMSVRIAAALMLWPAAMATAGVPLVPHQIKDMLFVGQAGASHSILTRSMTLAGDYLYVSGQPGLQTVRVSDPSNLMLTHDYTATSLQPNQAAVRGNVLYLANWSPGVGLLLLNLSNPAQPTHLKTISTSLHAWNAEIFDQTLYLSIGAETDSGVNTYSLGDPANPALIDAFTIGDRLLNNVGRSGNYIYFTHKNELRVYNVVNPASPQFVRTINLNSTLGNVSVYNNRLHVLGRAVIGTEQGGMWFFSLADPSNPQQIGHWEQPEPRGFCFLGDYCVVPCSGSGIYTLNISNPANVGVVSHWNVSWPNTGPHGGFPITVAGAGRFVYIGTTSPNDLSCDSFDCPNYGARVYSVQVLLEPPIITEVAPDPEPYPIDVAYTRQLTLVEGVVPITWTVQQGPPGLQVSSSGLVSGWTPSLNDVGSDISIEIKAVNTDGQDTEGWFVRPTLVPDGDFDNDGDSDLTDFAHFQICLSGDAFSYAPGCGDADFDADDDVDGQDLSAFLNCLRGAELPPGC